MNRHNHNSKEMVSMRNKNKVSCSTPEHQADSPSRDSDSIYDSDAASPVPFLCTQDGAEGETDVVWNFYTPKSEHTTTSRLKNSTPVSRRPKRSLKSKPIEKQLPKKRPVRLPQKKTELFQELIELNQNLHELMAKKPQTNCPEKVNSGSEEDLFNESPEFSPKSRLRSNSRCLRRNVLSSNFVKPDPDAALESDDSMNECLLKASQMVEENIINEPTAKRSCVDTKINNRTLKPDFNFKMDQDSMDAILNSIKLDSPSVTNNVKKKYDSPKLNNDSFDSFVGNLNDSVLDRLTQAPDKMKAKSNKSRDTSWTINEMIVYESTSPKSLFGRYNSMPVSPTVTDTNLPSTSGMVFGRYNSMPFGKDAEGRIEPSDSPIRCTPEEIKKKHQLAREKLMAKRLLPFTSSQKIAQPTQQSQINLQPLVTKRLEEPLVNKPKLLATTKKFQPRIPSTIASCQKKPVEIAHQNTNSNGPDIKSIIERKRQEALMKLRRRQIQSKMI